MTGRMQVFGFQIIWLRVPNHAARYIAFLFSGFVAKTLLLLPAPSSDSISLQAWLYYFFRAGYPSTNVTSLLFSSVFLLVIFLPLYGLYRKNIIIKV
mgnify:CR=1 FL=1